APYNNAGTYTVTAGTYSYLVTDANGCTGTVNTTVTQPALLTASAVTGSITCYNGSTSLNISALGGTSPYTNTGTYTLTAGSFSYQVQDAHSCSVVVTGSVSQPAQLIVSAQHGTINCFGGTTTLNISATGGSAPYNNTGTYTLEAGPYSYSVTDANGCSSVVA